MIHVPATSLLAASLLLSPLLAAGPAAAEPAQPGTACKRVPSDFNGDGYADLAAGAPNTEEEDTWTVTGRVYLVYGSASGVDRGAAAQAITIRSPGLPEGAVDRLGGFGTALASGYFDADCYADLAVGTNGRQNAFAVLYGSAAGLSTAHSQLLDRTSIEGGESRTGTGVALAAGDFNGDGRDDLAVGARGQNTKNDGEDGDPQPIIDDGGAVGVLNGSATGITTTGSRWITLDSAGVPKASESYDGFGMTLAAGDFDGDGRADLAAAAPRKGRGQEYQTGGVVVLRGAVGGLSGAGAKWFDQNTAGVPGTNEYRDRFGWSLASGDVTGDRRADLVIGAPEETVGKKWAAGAITVLRGSASGVTATGAVRWDQNSPRIPGVADDGVTFGAALAIGDFNRDGRADLAVGAPYDSVPPVYIAGTVTVVYGAAGGLSIVGSRRIEQNSAGVPGKSEYLDGFGSGLKTIPRAYGGRDALVVGADHELTRTGSVQYEGGFTILPGGRSGLPGPTGYQFTPGTLPGAKAGPTDLGTSFG